MCHRDTVDGRLCYREDDLADEAGHIKPGGFSQR